MIGTTEKRYDVDRALHMAARIDQSLQAKHDDGRIILGRSPISAPYRHPLREPSYIVTPATPVLTSVGIDRFAEELLPKLNPDHRTSAVGGYADLHGGLSYPHYLYDSVPGYQIRGGRVSEDPSRSQQANDFALKILERETGKPAAELVRRIKVRVFPHSKLAEFVLEHEIGLTEGRYTYSPHMNMVDHALSANKLEVLRKDPQRLIDWLREQVEAAINCNGNDIALNNLGLRDIPVEV